MSKRVRWTFYTLLIVGVVVGGWYITLTERPDHYMPEDAPDDVALDYEGTTQAEAEDEDDEPIAEQDRDAGGADVYETDGE